MLPVNKNLPILMKPVSDRSVSLNLSHDTENEMQVFLLLFLTHRQFKNRHLIFMCTSVLPAGNSLNHVHVLPPQGQRRALNPLKLEV